MPTLPTGQTPTSVQLSISSGRETALIDPQAFAPASLFSWSRTANYVRTRFSFGNHPYHLCLQHLTWAISRHPDPRSLELSTRHTLWLLGQTSPRLTFLDGNPLNCQTSNLSPTHGSRQRSAFGVPMPSLPTPPAQIVPRPEEAQPKDDIFTHPPQATTIEDMHALLAGRKPPSVKPPTHGIPQENENR